MADQKISARTAASTLSGTETVPVIQGGADRKTTTQDIVNLEAGNRDTDVTLAANSDTKYPSQKAIKTYVDARVPYKSYQAIVTNVAGTFTILNETNGFGATTFTFSVPGTGIVRVTASAATFTANKSASPGSSLNNAGDAYFVNGFAASTTIFTFNIVKHDGTQAATPNFTAQLFEIRVYN